VANNCDAASKPNNVKSRQTRSDRGGNVELKTKADKLSKYIRNQQKIDLVKIDVEGYELNVLRGMQRPVPFLSFEVNLPEFRREGLKCVELLERLESNGKFNCAENLQHGLLLDRWLGPREFSQMLEHVKEKSIEVFWKTCHGLGHK